MSILVVLYLLVFSVLSARQFNDIFNPNTIMGAIWLVAILYLSIDYRFIAMSFESQAYIVIAFTAFAIGINLVAFYHKAITAKWRFNLTEDKRLYSKKVEQIYFMVILLITFCVAFYVSPYLNVFREMGSLPLYVASIRRGLTHGTIEIDHSVVLIKQLPLFVNIIALFLLGHYTRTKNRNILKLFWVAFLLGFFISMIDGSRSLFFRYFVAMAAIIAINERFLARKISYKKYVLIGSVMVTVFVAVGVLRSSGEFSHFAYAIPHILNEIPKYLFGPLVLFSERFHDLHEVYSSNMFSYGWLANITGQSTDALVVEYTSMGKKIGLGNTYTYLGGLINDFGYFGAIGMVFIIGTIVSLVYIQAPKNILFTVLYGLLVSSMVFSVFSEKFLSMLPHFVRVVFIYYVVYGIARVTMKSRSKQKQGLHAEHSNQRV